MLSSGILETRRCPSHASRQHRGYGHESLMMMIATVPVIASHGNRINATIIRLLIAL